MSLQSKIISYWNLDGNSTDEVGANDGTDTNITYSTANGKINQGAGFNGTSSKINVGASTSLKITGAFSISVWIKRSGSQTQYSPIFYKPHDVSLNEAYWLGFWGSSDSKITLGFYDGSGYQFLTSDTEISDLTWTHIVGSYDGTYLRIYINGTEDKNSNIGSKTISYSGDYDAWIGQEKSTKFIKGAIDMLGIADEALTSDDVAQLYNSGAGMQWPFITFTSKVRIM